MNDDEHLSDRTYDLQQIFIPPSHSECQQIIQSDRFERSRWNVSEKNSFILDKFPDKDGASCCFIRLSPDKGTTARFIVRGGYQLISCSSGGWVLKAVEPTEISYWIPQAPILRQFDSVGRILSEEPASIIGFRTSSEELEIEIRLSETMHLDMAIWCFQTDSSDILKELDTTMVLEKQTVFFWTSETTYQSPSDLYLYLVNGQIYTNRFIWPRKWKICSELDAYGLYVTLSGLELTTNKSLYDLFKRQILFSVISRQADDGAWYHGEWTKFIESHYRFHNGAMLLLEAALKEYPDEVVRQSLERAAQFIASKTDKTDLGLWFLHDSLEDTSEMMEEMCRVNGSNWIQKPVLGKSATNKLILNTHLDTIVSLEYYRQITGSTKYTEKVDSARDATRSLLALRPADFIYQLVYRFINLTILPESEAKKLPLVVRAIKRLTWKYLTPNLFRIKNKYPRLVMPNGFIERHLGMGHYDISYHPINILDLTRFWRCFPDEDLGKIIDDAVKVVANCSIMDFWAEKRPRHKSLVEMVDALYHLCTLKQDIFYRKELAKGIITLEEWAIGLPPSVLGSDPETVKISQRLACPSPTDLRLRVVNLSCNERTELLVINATPDTLELIWEEENNNSLSWIDTSGQSVKNNTSILQVPPKGWLQGKENYDE